MNPTADDLEHIKSCKVTILEQWHCDADCIDRHPVNLHPAPRQADVYIFKLLTVPDKIQPAAYCFAWHGRWFHDPKSGVKDFQKHGVAILDTQVPVELSNLGTAAYLAAMLWYLQKIELKKTPDFVQSNKWTKDKLDGNAVEFQDGSKKKKGKFFVWQRTDGKIAVCIVHEIREPINGTTELIPVSIVLSKRDIDEGIQEPKQGAEYYTFNKET